MTGQVPEEMEKLVKLPGVGRKTANVVLGTAYGIAVGVVVDTHVARISPPPRADAEKDPEKIEKDLMGQFAQKEWIVLSSPPDPARPPLLHGEETQVRRVPAWNRFVRGSEWNSG